MLSQRQAMTAAGTRQFVIDHMVRAVCSRAGFDAAAMLDELRGHRLSVDAVIDIYIPSVARLLGDMWKEDDIDFATVTVGSLRLQSLLSIASVESLDFIRPVDDALAMLVVVPLGEDHSLGAFVLAAQLRRLGTRVDLSFCETPSDLVSRFVCDRPDMVLFTAAGRATLESISGTVRRFGKVTSDMPPIVVGGFLGESEDVAMELSRADLVSKSAKEVVTLAMNRRKVSSGRRS